MEFSLLAGMRIQQEQEDGVLVDVPASALSYAERVGCVAALMQYRTEWRRRARGLVISRTGKITVVGGTVSLT